MRKITVFLFVTLLGITNVNAQVKKRVALYLKEFDLMLYPERYPDTISAKITDSTNIKIYIKDARGSSKFYISNSNNKIIVEGNYTKAVKLKRTVVDKFNGIGELIKRDLLEFYEPVKTSTWVYH